MPPRPSYHFAFPKLNTHIKEIASFVPLINPTDVAVKLKDIYKADYGRVKVEALKSAVLQAFLVVKPELRAQEEALAEANQEIGPIQRNPSPQPTPNSSSSMVSNMYNKDKPAKRSRTDEGGTATSSKKKKRDKSDGETKEGNKAVVPSMTLEDVGGLKKPIEDLEELIGRPLAHPSLYKTLKTALTCGILLHGPPGCGKTLLAKAMAGCKNLPLLSIVATELVSGVTGESEGKLRTLFSDAKVMAPCMLLIDEVDTIAPQRENAQREFERRVVAQLNSCLDDLREDGSAVFVVATSSRPESIDPSLRRAGRLEREVSIGVPDEKERQQILAVLARKMRLSEGVDFELLAQRSPGYISADLVSLVREASVAAIKRIMTTVKPLGDIVPSVIVEPVSPASDTKEPVDLQIALQTGQQQYTETQLETFFIEQNDFLTGLTKVQPSAKREGFATIPGVTWEDVGALHDVRATVEMSVIWPIRFPQAYEAVGVKPAAGILLYGPPGCGKTLVAKAIARESGASFISVKGPELLNKYVGESEKAVRQVFSRANASAPAIIFFDELDALCPKRDGDSNNQATQRVVNQLLTEMDGMESRKQVFVIAATNRPDIIDPAMLRSGRLGRLIYVGIPNADERVEILRTSARKTPLGDDVDLGLIARDSRAEGFSGADLASLVQEASLCALKDALPKSEDRVALKDFKIPSISISNAHFETAFVKTQPSVSKTDRLRYLKIRDKVCQTRGHINADKPPPAESS